MKKAIHFRNGKKVSTFLSLPIIAIAVLLFSSVNGFSQEVSAPAPPYDPLSEPLCLDDEDPSPACRELDEAVADLDATLTRLEAERVARIAAAEQAVRDAALAARRARLQPRRPVARPTATPSAPPAPTASESRVAGELPQVSQPEVTPAPPESGSTVTQRPNGSLEVSFADELVSGSLYRPDNPLVMASNRNSALSCFDVHVSPVFDSLHEIFNQTQATTIEPTQRRQLLEGYRDMLRCLYPCLTVEDAQFMMDCTDVRRLIRGINDPSIRENSALSTGDPALGCTVEKMITAYNQRQFTATKLVNGTCQEMPSAESRTPDRREYNLFSGLDIAVLFDNSGSMRDDGPAFAENMFPQFLEATQNLSQEARVILFSQNLGFARVRNQPFSPLVVSTRNPNYRAWSQEHVATLYNTVGDDGERHTRAASEYLSAHLRPGSDLILIIVTDEDDHEAPLPPADFAQILRNRTSGRINIDIVSPGGESYLRDGFPNLASLYQQPGISGVVADLDDNRPNGDIRTKIITQIQNLVNIEAGQWYPLPLHEAIGQIDHIELNGQILAPANYRLAAPNRIEFAPGTFNARVPTQVMVYSLPPGFRTTEQIQREWMLSFIQGLNSSGMDRTHEAPYTQFEDNYRRRYQARLAEFQSITAAAQAMLNDYRQQSASAMTAEKFTTILTQWNHLRPVDLSQAFTAFTTQDSNRLVAGGGRDWAPLVSWIRYEFPNISTFQPAPPPVPSIPVAPTRARAARGRTSIPTSTPVPAVAVIPPRDRCMSQVREVETTFQTDLKNRRVAAPTFTVFFDGLSESMREKIIKRILDCDLLVNSPESSAGVTPSAPATTPVPSLINALEQALQGVGGQSLIEQSLRARPVPASPN